MTWKCRGLCFGQGGIGTDNHILLFFRETILRLGVDGFSGSHAARQLVRGPLDSAPCNLCSLPSASLTHTVWMSHSTKIFTSKTLSQALLSRKPRRRQRVVLKNAWSSPLAQGAACCLGHLHLTHKVPVLGPDSTLYCNSLGRSR